LFPGRALDVSWPSLQLLSAR